MANRFFTPNQQFADQTGTPYAGGTLAFFASGTSTPLNTYSNSSLTIANTNPVILDSAGRAGNVFLQNLAYKVVLSDVNSNQIWTADPVYASDFSTVAQFQSGNGSPNGSQAGTAGSVGVPASVYWDATNDILYVCTATGTSSTAVWTAVNSTAQLSIPAPQGYLTPTTGVPVIVSDTTSTTIWYTSLIGNLIPIFSGSTFVSQTFSSDLSLVLTSSQAANTLYDVFAFNNGGVLTLVTGPAWSVNTAGSCARGTGGGTAQIARVNGIWTNAVQISGRNGASTFIVAGNQGTYLGTIFIDSAAGQVTCHRSFGQSRKWGIWNAYNREMLYLNAGDGTASWTPGTSTRPANNSTANSLTVLSGLPEEYYDLQYVQSSTVDQSDGNSSVTNSIGFNATSVATGKSGTLSGNATSMAGDLAIRSDCVARAFVPPSVGINVCTALEVMNGVTGIQGGNLMFGGSANMQLSARWRG